MTSPLSADTGPVLILIGDEEDLRRSLRRDPKLRSLYTDALKRGWVVLLDPRVPITSAVELVKRLLPDATSTLIINLRDSRCAHEETSSSS